MQIHILWGKTAHQDKDIKIKELGDIHKGETIIRKRKEEMTQEEDHIIGDIIDQNQEEIEVFKIHEISINT